MDQTQQAEDQSIYAALQDPALAFGVGIAFIVVWFIAALTFLQPYAGIPGCGGPPYDLRIAAWTLSVYAAMPFMSVAGVAYVRDRRQRYTIDTDSRRLVSPIVWGAIAVGLPIWWVLAGSPLPFSGRSGLRWEHLYAVVVVIPVAVLLFSMVEALILHRMHRRRHPTEQHHVTRGIRVVSVALMLCYALLAGAIVTAEIAVPPPDPPSCGGGLLDSF